MMKACVNGELMSKKLFNYIAALILTAAVIGAAQSRPAWASPRGEEKARPKSEIVVTQDGEYIVGGICVFRVSYKSDKLSDKAAVDVPAEISRQATFSYPDELYLAGCHITHFKENLVQNEMSSEDGDWQVCFGNRPDEHLTIYYYTDQAAETGEAVWYPLPTTETSEGYVCAPAMYTGVYAPGGIFIPQTGGEEEQAAPQTFSTKVGTVMVTQTASVRITESGVYGAGGICELRVEYYIPALANELHVEENVEISAKVPFPDNEGLLYLPGCHVFHYKNDNLVDQVTQDEGQWEICFAAIPNKETTIYFYYSENDVERVTSAWTPLKTRVEDGKACAPTTDFTGVYTPVGK